MGAASTIPPNTLLGGKIRLIQRIGSGGMGDVWLARNESTEAEVAVKTLAKTERSAAHEERFRREARLAATLSHRNVVRIFDLVDESDGTLGLVMELLRGGTLEACLRERGPLQPMQAIAVAVPILSALHHVQQKGIVHRDVKPANIFFAVEPDGHVIPKILDFGIAKLPAASSALTVDGSVLGTPHYMSPEQIRGAENLDGRSDMFSLAVVLYEMLTGIRVFQRDSAAASLASVLEHEVDLDPRIPPKVWLPLSRALAKRPYERQATCGELAEALRRAVDATDETLADALQQLRPRSDAIPESSAVSVSGFAAKPARKKARAARHAWTLAAAGAAAIVAAGTTFAVTRPSADARAAGDVPASIAAASAEPPAAALRVAPPETRPAADAANSAESNAGAHARTAATAASSAAAHAPVTPPAAPTAIAPKTAPHVAPRAPATAAPAKPAGAKPVATSPGF